LAGIGLSLAAGFAPMLFYSWLLYRLDRYEKEPFAVLSAVFGWGSVIAAGGAFIINTISSLGFALIFQSESAVMLTTTTLLAPVVEESLKGFAVLLVFLFFREEFDSRLDGILYAGITALGFAATENTWYIYSLGYLPEGWSGLFEMFTIRSFWVGWQHPFYTAFFGLSLAHFRLSKQQYRWIFPLIGFSAAVFLHALHNLLSLMLYNPPGILLSRAWDWTGYLGLLIFIFAANQREKRWLKEYLADEVDNSVLTKLQLRSLMGKRSQIAAVRKQSTRESRIKLRKFFHLAGELMHKKRQKSESIPNSNIDITIDQLRAEVKNLSNQIMLANSHKTKTRKSGKELTSDQSIRTIPLSQGKDEQQDPGN